MRYKVKIRCSSIDSVSCCLFIVMLTEEHWKWCFNMKRAGNSTLPIKTSCFIISEYVSFSIRVNSRCHHTWLSPTNLWSLLFCKLLLLGILPMEGIANSILSWKCVVRHSGLFSSKLAWSRPFSDQIHNHFVPIKQQTNKQTKITKIRQKQKQTHSQTKKIHQ